MASKVYKGTTKQASIVKNMSLLLLSRSFVRDPSSLSPAQQQRAAQNDIQKRVNFCWWLNPHKSILLTRALTSKSGPIQCCPKTSYYVF